MEPTLNKPEYRTFPESKTKPAANHGGGYQYRLCKKDSPLGLTERCFQQTPLIPASNISYLQYGDDKSTRKEFQAIRVSEGVWPKGSVWTRNPVAYSAGHTDQNRDEHPVFEPALPELSGGGMGPSCGSTRQFVDPAFEPAQPYGACSKEEWDQA